MDRLQGWVRFCQDVQLGMNERLVTRQFQEMPLPSDLINDHLRNSLSGLQFPPYEMVDERISLELVDLAQQWVEQLARHQSLTKQSTSMSAFQRLTEAEQKIVDTIPELRDLICFQINHVLENYCLSVEMAREICMHAATHFSHSQDMRMKM
jgi:hypothetical protein